MIKTVNEQIVAQCDTVGCHSADLVLPGLCSSSDALRSLMAEHGWSVMGDYDTDAATFCPQHKPGAEPFAGTPRTKAFLDSLSGAETVNHPQHYGGRDNPYEAIKVIEAWGLGFCLGNTVKYIARHAHKGSPLEDLKKARWYLQREIERLEAGT